MPSLEHSFVLAAINNILIIYHHRAFSVKWILTDCAFEHLRAPLMSKQINLNVTAANEHVPEVERFIRVIKERVCGYMTTSPIDWMPNIMKIHLLQHIVQMINLTIQPNGVSDTFSPSAIVIGTTPTFIVALSLGHTVKFMKSHLLQTIFILPELSMPYHFVLLATFEVVLSSYAWTPGVSLLDGLGLYFLCHSM